MGIPIELSGLVFSVTIGLVALKRKGLDIDIGWLNTSTFFYRMRWQQKANIPLFMGRTSQLT
jgi:hypothetical protein